MRISTSQTNCSRSKSRTRALGIDPGLATTGYAVVEEAKDGAFRMLESGSITTSGRSSLGERLAKLYRGLDGIIREYSPHILALEKLYSHYKHPTTVIMMGHARGIACLLSGIHGIRLIDYASTTIKKAVTGNGHASKYQVQRMMQSLLGLARLPEPPDVSDALALAVCHFYVQRGAAYDYQNIRQNPR